MISDILNDTASSLLQPFEILFEGLLYGSFYIEQLAGIEGSVLSTASVSAAVSYLYLFTVVLLALKLVWKGEKVYVLWIDGDAEVSPSEMLIRSVFALGTALAFPLLYDYGAKIAIDIVESIINCFTIFDATPLSTVITAVNSILLGSGTIMLLAMLVYIIVMICLVIQMLGRGVEMLIYRLGFPIAVVGLVDSDGGVFRSYMQMFFKQLATIAIQYFCLLLGTRIFSGNTFLSLVLGICILITAFKMPKLLNTQIIAGSGGGRGGAYTLIMAARMFAGGG